MSGLIGHVTYAILAAREAEKRGLAIAPVLRRHWASYLCGSYLGCDIQTLPEAVCMDTGCETGYGTVPIDKSPFTGGPVRPWKLSFGGDEYTARDLHKLFYGRSHLVFGWSREELDLQEPWDHVGEYFGWAARDALTLFGSERAFAYILGTLAHVVGDSLIKSVHPGLHLKLLDGQYTPRNRPIQDLITFHEVGRKELNLDWTAVLNELAATPVEPVQGHAMRVGERRGELGRHVPEGWRPDLAPLLGAVMEKNRSYLKVLIPEWIQELRLEETPNGWDCCRKFQEVTGLHYSEMVELAHQAGFREALGKIGETIASLLPSKT